jgi:hypothetical protein
MLQGKYERDEVLDAFDRKIGSKMWPPLDKNDSPFDTFKCKICNKEFRLQMFGAFPIGQTDNALEVLAEHMNIKH